MITTCTICGGLYEAGSEEQAYEAFRLCFECRKSDSKHAAAVRRRADSFDFDERQIGGVIDSAGNVLSDADPGL